MTDSTNLEVEEREVRALLRRAGGSAPPSVAERGRIAEAMAVAFDTAPQSTDARRSASSEHELGVHELELRSGDLVEADRMAAVGDRHSAGESHGSRVLLWAAVLVVLAALGGALVAVGGSPGNESAGPIETSRHRVELESVAVSFHAPVAHTSSIDAAGVATVAASSLSASHFNIRIVQVDVFDGVDAETYLAALDLDPQPGLAQEGAVAWHVRPGQRDDCLVGEPCESIAELPDGSQLQLLAGSLTRIDVFEVDGGPPVVVVAEVASQANGPALRDVRIED